MFKSGSEEGRGDRSKADCSRKAEERIVGMGGYQAEVAVDGGDWAERRMWDAGQRDNMNSFLTDVCWRVLDHVMRRKQPECVEVVGETKFDLGRKEKKATVNKAHVMA